MSESHESSTNTQTGPISEKTVDSSRKSHMIHQGLERIRYTLRSFSNALRILVSPADSGQIIRSIINFLFRIPLSRLYIIYILTYFILVTLFVGLIILAAVVDPTCIRCGNTAMSFQNIASFDGNTAYSCAFLLSWVTFSTVVKLSLNLR